MVTRLNGSPAGVSLPLGTMLTVVALNPEHFDGKEPGWFIAEPLPAFKCGQFVGEIVSVSDAVLTPYRPWEDKSTTASTDKAVSA
jgi:hypothetical protein